MKDNKQLVPVDLSQGVPSLLEDVQPAPFDLVSDYWTPENIGDKKRMYFQGIRPREVKDESSGESFQLDCAYFLEPTQEGTLTISNGSKRLVAALQNNNVESGTPLEITYLGKKKNSTNSFKSDHWSIRPLILKSK